MVMLERSFETQLNDLWEAVLNLTLPGEDQVQLLDAMGDSTAIDELALALDDSFWTVNEGFTRNQLSRDELNALNKLNACLNRMSGEDKADVWTVDALKCSDDWQEVRQLATQAILSRQISRVQRASA
jgi:hypothetical protein